MTSDTARGVDAAGVCCVPLSYHHLSKDLADEFARASMTILKGDLNYRRLVGDCDWPPTMSFAALSAYWPSPLAVLRTLKSDVIVGIANETLSTLDARGEPWRTNDTRAVIQARGLRAWRLHTSHGLLVERCSGARGSLVPPAPHCRPPPVRGVGGQIRDRGSSRAGWTVVETTALNLWSLPAVDGIRPGQ